MVSVHTFRRKRKRMPKLRRRKGDLAASMFGLLCMGIGMSTIVAVTTWISAQRAETRASVYLTVHNLNCMERLAQEAKTGTGDLLETYGMGEYSSTDIDTTVSCTQFSVEGMNCYTVKIKSHFKSSPYRLSSSYVLTSLTREDTTPEVNPE